jgi:capsule polysaccharide modification protein KpsS
MIAERKAIRNQNVSYLAVTYYSLFTVMLSIFANYYKAPYPALDQINLAASVIVLVASLVAAGFRLEARAASFRECYLKLQRLYDEALADDEKKLKYRDILMDFSNHSPHDYKDLIVNHTVLEGKSLSIDGKDLTHTYPMMCSWLARGAFYYGLLIVLFVGPIVFLLWPFLTSRAQ